MKENKSSNGAHLEVDLISVFFEHTEHDTQLTEAVSEARNAFTAFIEDYNNSFPLNF